MSKDKKSQQGAVMWAVVPGLACLVMLMKVASGLFTSYTARQIYLTYEFKADLWYVFGFGCLAIFPFIIQFLRQKKTAE